MFAHSLKMYCCVCFNKKKPKCSIAIKEVSVGFPGRERKRRKNVSV